MEKEKQRIAQKYEMFCNKPENILQKQFCLEIKYLNCLKDVFEKAGNEKNCDRIIEEYITYKNNV
jgi:hypothetical protein